MIEAETRVIPFIEGDGIGLDVTAAMRKVLDAAVSRAYERKKRIEWMEVLAGEKAQRESGAVLPRQTLEAFSRHRIGIKGPLTTPLGKGMRSLNVAIRQALDLYSCIRPIRWWGSFSVLPSPEKVDMVIFRENTEGLYSGVEFEPGSVEAGKIIALLRKLGVGEERLESDSGLGLKIASERRTKRHARAAFRFAIENERSRITVVHKGNILKHTEGAFWQWCQEVAGEAEFSVAFGKTGQSSDPDFPSLVLDGRIADNMFQQIYTRPGEFDVVVTTNLNGDYLSEAAAAIVGGVGMIPSCNMGDDLAVFEPTHGSAPKYAGKDMANPTSLILSGAMMLTHMGWSRAAEMIEDSVRTTLASRMGTFDLVRGWKRGGQKCQEELSCSDYAAVIVNNFRSVEAAS